MNADAVIDQLASNFDFFDDWEQRYEYITELGDKLGDLPESDRSDATKVHGCMSNVYITGDLDDDGILHYRAECDTAVIRGVIALLLKVYTGRTPREALDIDADSFFDRLGLFDHLSPTRHVGVYAIVERIRAVAAEHMTG